MTDILIVGVDNDLGVSGWVCPIFVRPWVQGRHVDVLDLFSKSSLCLVMQFDGIGAAAEEGVSGLERVDDFQRVEELTEIWVGLDFLVPVTLPSNARSEENGAPLRSRKPSNSGTLYSRSTKSTTSHPISVK